MLLTALLALSQPAAALDVKWWGVGPTIGTVAIPGEYPIGFPDNAKKNGSPMVQKVAGDIDFGVHAVMYPTGNGRIGARGLVGLGLGSPWSSGQLTVEYDHAIVKEDGFQLLLGAGIGAGTERFGGTTDHEDGYLITNYFPLRGQVTALLRDRTRAYELNLFGAYHIAADQTYFANKDAEGTRPTGVGGLAAVYAKLGIEATVFFGDFKSDKNGGKQASSKGSKKKRR